MGLLASQKGQTVLLPTLAISLIVSGIVVQLNMGSPEGVQLRKRWKRQTVDRAIESYKRKIINALKNNVGYNHTENANTAFNPCLDAPPPANCTDNYDSGVDELEGDIATIVATGKEVHIRDESNSPLVVRNSANSGFDIHGNFCNNSGGYAGYEQSGNTNLCLFKYYAFVETRCPESTGGTTCVVDVAQNIPVKVYTFRLVYQDNRGLNFPTKGYDFVFVKGNGL